MQPDERSITDPRVVSSYGGGWSPEQHWGVLANSGFFWGPLGHVVPYEEYENQGCFDDDETRQQTFTECLNQIEAAGYGDAFTVDASIFFQEGIDITGIMLP